MPPYIPPSPPVAPAVRGPTAPAPAKAKDTPTPRPEFEKIWSANTVSHIPRVHYEMLSWYTPNCICLFETLAEMETLLNKNKLLPIIAPNYFSLPARVYYAVIFYVHILNARTQSTNSHTSDGSWLRSFYRQFQKTDLPIAGPLIAFFANITSCLPEDDQFNYVYPTVPTNGTYSAINSGTSESLLRTITVHPAHHLFPCVPFLATMLRKFCRSPSLPDDMFDSKGQFVPFNLTNGSGPDGFAGVVFAPHVVDTANPTTAALLSNPALSRPFPEKRTDLEDIHVLWRKAFAQDIPSMNVSDSYDPTSLKDQTLLGDGFDWFRSCIDAASKQAMFFSDSTNLSQIPTAGNSSCLIESRLTFTKHPAIPTIANEWYPNIYSNVTAKFRATSPKLSTEMMESAIFAVSNASLKWKDADDQPIGSFSTKSRHGPYFENQKYTHALEQDGPVLSNMLTTVETHFYRPLPEM